MSVVTVVPVVVAAKVVPHLVYGGVVGVGAALLHRGQSVAATGAGRVGVAAPTVVEVVGQQLGGVSRASAEKDDECLERGGGNGTKPDLGIGRFVLVKAWRVSEDSDKSSMRACSIQWVLTLTGILLFS